MSNVVSCGCLELLQQRVKTNFQILKNILKLKIFIFISISHFMIEIVYYNVNFQKFLNFLKFFAIRENDLEVFLQKIILYFLR